MRRSRLGVLVGAGGAIKSSKTTRLRLASSAVAALGKAPDAAQVYRPKK